MLLAVLSVGGRCSCLLPNFNVLELLHPNCHDHHHVLVREATSFVLDAAKDVKIYIDVIILLHPVALFLSLCLHKLLELYVFILGQEAILVSVSLQPYVLHRCHPLFAEILVRPEFLELLGTTYLLLLSAARLVLFILLFSTSMDSRD